jgi:methylmalonyl-CoA mutase
MAQRDPWVNILRGTVSCFSAAVSGAHSITVLPFDYALGQPDEFSQRIARNTQIILQEESSLNRVVDPAGGSWYVETLTQQMAEKAWALFQEIETEGGLIQSLHDGHIQKRIKEKALERFALIATRKMPLTGVSEFPNINEDTIEKDEIDFADLFAAAEAELQNPPAYHGKGIADVLSAPDDVTLGQLADALAGDKCMLPPLPNFSHYKEFEDLRAASDAHLEKTGQRPRIFMATLGPVAQHTARATFAKNFFEAGGIETLPGAAYASAADVAAAFAASGTDFAVVCSSDHQYDSHGQETVRALKAAGAKAIYLAGRMGEDKPAYDAAGVSDYIYVGANVLAVLRDTLDKMGVSR